MPYKDKEKARRHAQQYRKTHRAVFKKSADKYRRKLRRLIRNIKQNLGCQECGEANPVCLVFHHINANKKGFAVAHAVNLHSKGKVLEEINKCIVLCRNCHAKIHVKED